MLENIAVSSSPHISKPLSTRTVMLDVIIALVPAMIAAVIFFRLYAVTILLTCIVTAVITELICNHIRKKPNSLGDLSAILTAILLALSLPPAIPLWAVIIGTAFAIAIGKMVFGGLGANVFNPAMVGRAFLTASFGMLMTTWTVPATINPEMPTITESVKSTDIRTQATPLAKSKEALKGKINASVANNLIKDAFTGQIGGCLGETSTIALLIGAAYLLIRKTITIHIPLAVLISAFIFAGVAYLINPDAYISPLTHLTTGGMLLCAFFIATDPVTAPLTTKGMWIFGIGVGAIVMLIRIIGEYPEGIMYAILLMNAVTPLIDRLCRVIPVGGIPNAKS
ncbi:MAG: RnfABCDGE type electron transport complex subunit D [Planctomycetes bacterium]|nr:RnfABCDGE type electron transport complex subunit D [Planctomycetota bacterium]